MRKRETDPSQPHRMFTYDDAMEKEAWMNSFRILGKFGQDELEHSISQEDSSVHSGHLEIDTIKGGSGDLKKDQNMHKRIYDDVSQTIKPGNRAASAGKGTRLLQRATWQSSRRQTTASYS